MNSIPRGGRSFVLFVVTAVLCLASVGECGTYSGGSGEPNDPYLIATAEQMNAIGADSNDWDKHFKLVNDIDLSGFTGTQFNIIGPNSLTPFTGVFDGNGHTISNFTYESDSSTNEIYIGLFGYNDPNAKIQNIRLENYDVNSYGAFVGPLVAANHGIIKDCYVSGNASKEYYVGGLTGYNIGVISNCSSIADVYGVFTGGLVGNNGSGTILRCYASGKVHGITAGGLVGANLGEDSIISDCFSTADVYGDNGVGGLVGHHNLFKDFFGQGYISNCYATGRVRGDLYTGGLVGWNAGDYAISYCYSVGIVDGNGFTGAFVGGDNSSSYISCFCDSDVNPDVNGIGNRTDPNVTGKTTAEMQTESTFTDAGWDFTTPIWKMCDEPNYPKLWWEEDPKPDSPVLHSEPEMTLLTSNTISWDLVADVNSYYAECVEDANFATVTEGSGWITDVNCTFEGLELGQTYWYRVKARNDSGTESDWSNVESSMQVGLDEAVETVLDVNSLKNENMAGALGNKIDAVMEMIEDGHYQAALEKLENDILKKTDGCAEQGQPDKNDWIEGCEEQGQVYPLIIETIEYVRGLIE